MQPRFASLQLLFLAASLIEPRAAAAQRTMFEYTGKVVCGPQIDSTSLAVVRGFYATSVNVRNTAPDSATVRKSVVWTFPTERRGAEAPVNAVLVSTVRLMRGQAFTAECGELDSLTRMPLNRFREGMLTLLSDRQLDVIGVYTAAPVVFAGGLLVAGQVSTLHLDRFPARTVPQ
jgi:hypothetical protein